MQLLTDTFRQIAILLGQLLGFFQCQFGFALSLGIEVIAQRLQLDVDLLVALFIDLSAHSRQFLTIIGRQLCQLEFIDFGLARSGFGLQ
ncbi:hypothetical protein D3C78_1219100 [compost metagenome]